jgi:hypothetical protein
VGALILTMVFPLVLAPENEIAQSTRDLFGDDVAYAFRVVYQVRAPPVCKCRGPRASVRREEEASLSLGMHAHHV